MLKTMGQGRFVRDPELKEVGDTCVCEFSLAVNEHRKINGERKKYAHFFDCVIWDKAAELIVKYCRKGDQIGILATPRQERWEDAEGKKRSRIVLRVDEFTFLSKSHREEEVETETEDFT